MIVRKVSMAGFGSYSSEAVSVDLPDRGLVVVTGANGAGKSSIVEAVATAMWGKSLRGTALWGEAEVGAVTVDSDLVSARRWHSAKGRTSLAWELVDPAELSIARLRGSETGDAEHENTTKAQARLEAVVGDFDVWRRTSVLSSADAAHFALATDSERKWLLEQVLGLDRFEQAHAACRNDLKAALTRRAGLERDVEVARASLDGARQNSERAEEALKASPEPEDEGDLRTRQDRLAAAARDNAAILRDVRDRQGTLTREEAEATVDVRQAKAEVARFQSGNCPSCGQGTRHLHVAAERELATVEQRARAALSAVEAAKASLRAELHELEEERDQLAQALADARAALAGHQQAADLHRAAVGAADAAMRRLEDWTEKNGTAASALRQHADESAELEMCEQVLGMRGVRATMLDRALGAIQQQANAWLRRLAFPGSIRLSSVTELKTGKVVDAISLEVEGTGGGKYRGSSGGERRRIDVALLLGLAEVASAARGGIRGTLFADELFDALDKEGIAAASQALADLSRDRPVVVVTHNSELAEQLPAALRLHVEAGSVVRI